jgi:hypothetical protein
LALKTTQKAMPMTVFLHRALRAGDKGPDILD